MINLNDINEVIAEVEKIITDYYEHMDSYEQNPSGIMEIGNKLAAFLWFLAKEEAELETNLEFSESTSYNEIKVSDEGATIPEIKSKVKEMCIEEARKYRKVHGAVRALDRLLTQLAVRAKYVSLEKHDYRNNQQP